MPVRKVEAAGPGGATAPADRALLRHSGRPSPGGSFVPRWTSPGFTLTAICCRRFMRSMRCALCHLRTSFGSPGWRGTAEMIRRLPGPVLLLWTASHAPSAPGATADPSVSPVLVDSGMIQSLRGLVAHRVEVVSSSKARAEGVSGMIFTPRIRARRPNVPDLRCTARLPPLWLTGCGPFLKQNGHRIAVPVGVPWRVRDGRIRAFRSVPARR